MFPSILRLTLDLASLHRRPNYSSRSAPADFKKLQVVVMNVMEWRHLFVILVLFGTLYMPSGNNFIVWNQCFQSVYVILYLLVLTSRSARKSFSLIIFYLLLGGFMANFAPLTKGQPHSPDVTH